MRVRWAGATHHPTRAKQRGRGTHRDEVTRESPLCPPLAPDVVRQPDRRQRNAPVALVVELRRGRRGVGDEGGGVHVLFEVEVEVLEDEGEGLVQLDDVEEPGVLGGAGWGGRERGRRRRRERGQRTGVRGALLGLAGEAVCPFRRASRSKRATAAHVRPHKRVDGQVDLPNLPSLLLPPPRVRTDPRTLRSE